MLKLIALRPLKGCAPYIRKCLKEDIFYYFCDDFRINLELGVVKRKSINLNPLPEDFFLANPQVNISAVVGKNGDGKSSLIELMIRLINNCAITNNLTAEKDSLRWVKGVRAELYYLVDNVLYMLRDNEEKEGAVVFEMADLRDQRAKEWSLSYPKLIDINQHRELFFFTFVSNYSHYAYNAYDYQKEWEIRGNEEDVDECCWLHHIFHKNDVYMAPLTLYPYRHLGDQDVNQEKDLSKQRLLSIFVNADDPDVNPLSLRRVNGKDADTLLLEEDICKLQKTLLDFFIANKDKQKLRFVINQIEQADKQLSKGNDMGYEKLVDTYLPYFFEDLLDETLDLGKGFKTFVGKVVGWLKINYKKALPNYSDIHVVYDSLKTLNERYSEYHLDPPLKRYNKQYAGVWGVNAVQLGRLNTIYRIFQLLDYDPNLLTEDYRGLSKLEKCQLYKVYKVWSILRTYPQYKKLIYTEEQSTRIKEASPMLEECYKSICEDNYSYITRELRQVDNYIAEGLMGGDFYERIGMKDLMDGKIRVNISKLKEHYGSNYVKLDQLPPAIYRWDVLFKKTGGKGDDIEMDSFSSGEKQMLNTTGAIVYHLQNLANTAITHYENVNVVLEEIELYYHPDYQRKMIWQLLNQIGRSDTSRIKSINIILVTHSPFILSDIPKNNVLFLADGNPIYNMQENTFGANIHSLLKNGFFLPNLPMGEFAYEKINELFRKLNEGDLGKADYTDIYQQILLVGEPYLRGQLLKMYKELKDLVN